MKRLLITLLIIASICFALNILTEKYVKADCGCDQNIIFKLDTIQYALTDIQYKLNEIYNKVR